jgi:putative nucleotidyltransferase with HDIG domain
MSGEVTERSGAGLLAGALVVSFSLLLLALLLAVPSINPAIAVPVPHFWVVSAVALLAFLVAFMLAVSAAQLQHYKLLLLAIGFMAMAGLFTVHGLATPGVLVSAANAYGGIGSHSVVGVAGFLSLAVPAIFFAIGYLPLLSLYERRLPFWPAGGLVLVAISGVVIFGIVAFLNSDGVADLPVMSTPVIYAIASLAAACLLFAGYRQFKSYLVSRLRLQGSLALAFPLLACAQLAQIVSQPWTLAWWEYHLLMLGAVSLAFTALLRERRRGRGYRTILEAALDLQVKAEIELENVAEIAALAAAIEAKDDDTRGHTVRVAELTVGIARELDMPAPMLRYLARAGLLHDIGKLHIPDAILLKPGPLTDEEWVVMKKHPEMGLDILRRMGKFEKEAEVVLSHHERIDGSGYPQQLKGDEIPLGARILAVADTYDVLVSDRPYRKARSRDEAIRILDEESGAHLWAPAVDALKRMLHEHGRQDRRMVPRLEMLHGVAVGRPAPTPGPEVAAN